MKKIYLILLIFTIINCKNDNTSKLYSNFENYLLKNHNTKINDGIYLIVPLNICHSCVEETIKKLNNPLINKSIHVILADYTKLSINETKNKINNKLHILSDNKMQIVKQNIASGNFVIIFVIKNKKIKKVIYKPNENDEEIEKIIYYQQ